MINPLPRLSETTYISTFWTYHVGIPLAAEDRPILLRTAETMTVSVRAPSPDERTYLLTDLLRRLLWANLPEKVELRKTQTERGTAGGSRSSFPLTMDSTTAVSSSSLRLSCDVISCDVILTRRAHRKCRPVASCTITLDSLHLVVSRHDWHQFCLTAGNSDTRSCSVQILVWAQVFEKLALAGERVSAGAPT